MDCCHATQFSGMRHNLLGKTHMDHGILFWIHGPYGVYHSKLCRVPQFGDGGYQVMMKSIEP